MAPSIAAIVCGIVVLAWAADQFVLGAARVALIRGVPSLVVGVVVIGFGTSTPELLVSAAAMLSDEPEIAVGNVVGSNVANLSLLLGLGAVMVPLTVASRTVTREALLVVAAVILFGLAVQGGGISRLEGAALIVAMGVALAIITRSGGDDLLGEEAADLADAPTHRFGAEVLRTIVGLAGTIAGAQVLLYGATRLADEAGLADGFVGVTMVAVGTSLPELITVVQSARRHETDLIVGNLLGSNLFNALAVGGVIGLTAGPPLDDPSLTTTAVAASVVVAVVATVVMWTGHVATRREGIGLVLAYLALIPMLA